MSKAERTRQFIIEQTAPIFNKLGYAGTSMSDLTAATGLTKGAIYGNFENKEEVALAAFDYNLGLVQEGLRAGLHGGATVREQLLAMPRFYREAYPHFCQQGGCPILNAAIETDDAPPTALRQRVQASLARWHRHVARLIEQGQQTGEIRPAAEAGRYATLFIALTEGGIMVAKATGDPAALYTSLAHIEQLIETELASS
ncbi:TetR/AcrR family transcriptional regulator [Hymenobacter busanensis]|uniref:TetR/AcrR family transcriptional regulator n=1 Tax=Hymenobacter busanensis TaxID=2607656 RepID=A0A7L4ZTN5_9BACT|nr:TetR/AcrR family transcriptional regulator [Hymenobacter busanensis]KAA9339500.1 TetR/AcrR family transcriptional regulator [Hymenobacter busanensis]QHJ06744.1 TetR family transcriptional regulator [Hymenobacter busanensis]